MKRLSDAEEMVMSVIWNNDELMSLEEIRKNLMKIWKGLEATDSFYFFSSFTGKRICEF